MSDPCVFVVKPRAISLKDKSALRKAGVIVVETDDPSSVRFIRPLAEISSTEMLRCAMKAIDDHGCDGHKKNFVKLLTEIVLSKATDDPPPPGSEAVR